MSFNDYLSRLIGKKPKEPSLPKIRVCAKEILTVRDRGFRGEDGCETNLFATVVFENCDFGVAERTMRLAHQRAPALVAECFKQAQTEALRKLIDDPAQPQTEKV